MRKIALVILSFMLCAISFAQTNTKYQSQIKTSDALYKIESTKIGSVYMSGYHTVSLQVVLRKWTNIATNAKRYDIELLNDVAFYLEKGDWNYVINSLKYIQDALTNNLQEGTEYSFRTSGGILFTTKGSELLVDIPQDDFKNHKIKLEDIGKLVETLEKAVSQAK